MTVSKNPYWKRNPNRVVSERLDKISKVASKIERTVRRITYILYPKLHGKELENAYNNTVKDVVRARITGIVPWKNIRESRTKLVDREGYDDIGHFLFCQEVEDLEKYYSLSKRPSHKKRFLVWFEKETVLSEFEAVCSKYDVPYLCGRGQATWTRKHHMAVDKLDGSWDVLYFGDNDEKGHEIHEVIERDLEYFGCKANVRWVMMTKAIEDKYDLPEEARLDGLELDDLENEIEEIVLAYIDIEKYKKILRQEKTDKVDLQKYKLVLQKKE